MLLKWIPGITLLYSAHTLAQTTTSCNPTEKTCSADIGLSVSSYTHDFTADGADDLAWNVTSGSVTYSSKGAAFTVSKSGDSPTIRSNWYIFFGRVSFVMKAASGTGIVSSAILQSDDLDEVDWEWIGGSADKAQTNYFGKGNTTTYDRAAWSATSDTQTTSHNYTIQWTQSATTWYIDGVATRTLNYADAVSGRNYPQTPMDIRIGSWAGGDSSNSEGTIEWAGGATDYTQGPFTMYLEKIEVENYNPGASYTYSDTTGSYDSITVGKASSSSVASKASSTKTSTALGARSTTDVPAQMAQMTSGGGRGFAMPGWQYVAMFASTVLLGMQW
ncbi:glycoside hydrolase family 16 protein [Dothidotthia symphoricarpi CBS 119687]|uniref:chitinase n=1 Tax=Dothidotthia symphoricarpi CBS 119687 TaxID=1392245 RepID=A0A6A6AQP7_9PLEO|nr:glycoside hydrolase family 16 protein [Dothidotthia symphoricarpi CBS 119687]KAF2133167.1 glycoside hydrolase family 16 protein [Dothidotthia symphoricarpi CBS 119687]